MTEHPAMIELMQQALDGGLDDGSRVRLNAHVATCAGCTEEWAGLQMLHRQLLAAPQQASAAGFAGRVLARIAAEQAQAPLPVASALPARAAERPIAAAAHGSTRRAAVLPLLAFAGVLGLAAVALLLAPLAGLVNVDVWTGFFADSLGLLTAGIAWLSVLLTFIMVGVQTAGDGLLAAAVLFGLVMTFIWIRLVAGVDFVRRPTYSNGGV